MTHLDKCSLRYDLIFTCLAEHYIVTLFLASEYIYLEFATFGLFGIQNVGIRYPSHHNICRHQCCLLNAINSIQK